MFSALFSNPNLLWAAAGCAALGVLGGVVGTFLLLRKRSLLADAVSHATLPGVVVAFLASYALGAGRHLGILLAGGLVAGLTGAAAVPLLRRHARMKEDAAIACVLAVWYALGAYGLGLVQQLPGGGQAGLEKFLLGQAAGIVASDAWLLTLGALAVSAVAVLLYKELRLAAFDPGFASVAGFGARKLDALLLLLTTVAVVLALPAVGLALAVAMMVIPPAAARFWSDRLWVILLVAAGIGAAAGLCGALASATEWTGAWPTGPAVVLAAALVFGFSALFAPRRGMLARALRHLAASRRIAEEDALAALWRMEEHRIHAPAMPAAVFLRLKRAGKVEGEAQAPHLTAAGRAEATLLVKTHRLWEAYLSAANLPADQLHAAAHKLEHGAVSPKRLADETGHPVRDPHGRDIPTSDPTSDSADR